MEKFIFFFTRDGLKCPPHMRARRRVIRCARVGDSVTQPESDAITSGIRPGCVVAGKYRVEKILGSGGMGIVVAARHLTLGENVALKLLRDESLASATGAARLMREARALARLKSAHVARIFDAGEHEGTPFLVLELLEGKDLQRLTRESKDKPTAVLVDYIAQACEGVAEAHALGIIHRDLKPQNLFIVRERRGHGLVKVLDFGIARTTDASDPMLTQTSELVGTPHYMAPEQLRGGAEIDARADVWALGACLYAVLAGRPPFQGTGLIEIGARILRDDPQALHHVRPDVPRGLSDVVAKCLAKVPDERFSSVEALAEALAPFRVTSSPASDAATPCLDDNVLAEMQEGALGSEALARVERHAASCSACRARVGAAAPAPLPRDVTATHVTSSATSVTAVMDQPSPTSSLRQPPADAGPKRAPNVRLVSAVIVALVLALALSVSLARNRSTRHEPSVVDAPASAIAPTPPIAAAAPQVAAPDPPAPTLAPPHASMIAPAMDPRRPPRRVAPGTLPRGPSGGGKIPDER